jgi:hypothetical protein
MIPQVTQEGQVWSGLASTGTIADVFLKKGFDEMGKLAFLTRGETKFLRILTEYFKGSKQVKTREHPVMELSELDRTFNVTVASTDTNHTQFGVTNDQAAQLQPEDVLANCSLYANVVWTNQLVAGQVVPASGSTMGTNVGPDLGWEVGANPTNIAFSRSKGLQGGSYYFDYETFQIDSIGAKNSAGSGHTLLTVRRCTFGPSAKDKGGAVVSQGLVNTAIQAQNAVANMQAGDTLVRLLPSFYEGTGLPDGFFKNPVIDRNFTQEFKYAVTITEESKIEANRLPKQPLDMNRWLTTRRMNLDIEKNMLLGRKGKMEKSDGTVKYFMGGISEFIPKVSDNIHSHTGAISYTSLMNALEPIFYDGGGTERFFFCDPGLYVKFKIAFYSDSHMRFDPEASRKFDIPMESIVVAGGVLNIVPLYSLWEAKWRDQALVLDMSKNAFTPVTHADWDMKVLKGVQPPDSMLYKEGIVGVKGLERRYADHQHIVYFN